MISMMRLEQLYEKLWIPNYVELEGKDCRWLWRSKDEIGSLMTRRYLLWFVHISFLGLSYIQAWWGWCSSMREKKKKKNKKRVVFEVLHSNKQHWQQMSIAVMGVLRWMSTFSSHERKGVKSECLLFRLLWNFVAYALIDLDKIIETNKLLSYCFTG